MLKRIFPSVLVLGVALAIPLSAQWSYTFNGSWTFSPPDPFSSAPVTQNFVLSNAGPITLQGSYLTSSCGVVPGAVDPFTLSCPPSQEFYPDGFGSGLDLISAQYQYTSDNDGSGGGGAYFFFPDLSFGVPGLYNAVQGLITIPKDGIPDECIGDPFGDGCTQWFSFYASAGEATLLVENLDGGENIVPEPATMTLLATGLVGVAASKRRKRAKR